MHRRAGRNRSRGAQVSQSWKVVLTFDNVPDEATLNAWVWAMRQAGRDHGKVPFPTYEASSVIEAERGL